MRHRVFSFDTTGFMFAGKLLFAIFFVFSLTQQVIAMSGLSADTHSQTASVNAPLLDTNGENVLNSEKDTYTPRDAVYAALATHSVGTVAVDALNKARERLVVIDIGDKKTRLFLNGNETATYPILALGAKGTSAEVPTGFFSVEEKSEGRVLGDNVRMPSSIRFFGSFFIHGEPYDSEGVTVNSEYENNSVRLSSDDARHVFEFVEQGTPILIRRDAQNSALSIVPEKTLPRVSAKSFIVADIQSGAILAEKDSETLFPIASLSKLVTAIVAYETILPQQTLSISYEDRERTEGTPGSLPEGASMTLRELLFPLLIESNNSVAYTMARYFGSENFIAWMNTKVRAIGMDKTSFEDPSGISSNNQSTARDLLKLTRYIYNFQSYILNISRETAWTVSTPDGKNHELRNLNIFTKTPGFIGGKTGYTDAARETMVTVFDVELTGETRPVAIIVLGSEDRKSDVSKLLRWVHSL